MPNRNVLMIMHAREIPSALEALRSLHIDKAWFRGYDELQLTKVVSEFVNRTHYDNYIMISDDTTPTQAALDKVQEMLNTYGVASGWCNISPAEMRPALVSRPLTGSRPGPTSYRWMNQTELDRLPDEFETFFVNFALTGMRRELWQRFPFSVYVFQTKNGVRYWGSDFFLSMRLYANHIPMHVSKRAFVYHLASLENFIVGKVEKQIIEEKEQVKVSI